MIRCSEPAGTFEVQFQYLDPYGNPSTEKGDYNAEIGEHGDTFKTYPNGNLERDGEGQPIMVEPGPRASISTPYVGELCRHELDWVSMIPGRTYSRQRRYTVRALSGGE